MPPPSQPIPPSELTRPAQSAGRNKPSEFRTIFSLSAPLAIAQLGMMTMGVVDTMMVARIGVAELAAVAIATSWAWSSSSLFQGIVQGMDPLVSQAHGAGDGEASALALQRGLLIATVGSIPLMGLWVMTGPALLWLGQDAAVAELAQTYMLARLPSAIGFNLFIALRQYLAGRTIMRPAMWVMLAGNMFNVVLNWGLIFGHLGMPELGLQGAGLATGITNIFLPLALWIWSRHFGLFEGAWRRWDRHSFDVGGLYRYLKLGFPVGLQLALEANAFTVGMIMVGWIGVIELAAHQVVINMASFTFMLPLGVSIGSSVRIGNLIGARDGEHLQQSCRTAFAMGGGVMALTALVFVVYRNVLPTIYLEEVAVVSLAASLLPIAGAFQIADGVQVVGGGLMRGMGRPKAGAIVNLLGFYVIGLPLAWVLAFPMGLGVVGIWWGLAAGLGGVAIMLYVWVMRTAARPIAELTVNFR
ncbi:MAG: MATE family efflux transporter [Myxococcales bacterium]|nr:MATE family efflux transporter [Myxococcales bacterium]HIK85811.1 MATE family efflux transporter [Myxococcales bacterium]